MFTSPQNAEPTTRRKSHRKRGTSGVNRLDLLTLEDLDGRSRAHQIAVRMRDQLASDLGGDLTAAQQALAQRAGILHSILEDIETRWAMDGRIDLAEYCNATRTQSWLLRMLGLRRVAKDVSLLELEAGD